jgi:hypothetical protein
VVFFDVDRDHNVSKLVQFYVFLNHNALELVKVISLLDAHVLHHRVEVGVESEGDGMRAWAHLGFSGVDKSDISIYALVIQPIAWVKSHETLLG